MTVDFTYEISDTITADADGDVVFGVDLHRDEITFTIDQLRTILKKAEAHQKAYIKFARSGHEDEDQYWADMEEK